MNNRIRNPLERRTKRAMLRRTASSSTACLTTGVYCRPSCASRRPLRKNVRFYATPAEAERDGLRACLRCKPDVDREGEPIDARIRKACELISKQCRSAAVR